MPHVEQDKSLPDAIIVDIDGTVAKMNGRSPYDYSRVSEDLPNEPVVELVGDLSGENIIIYVSGRPYSCYEDTKKWIEENVSNQS